MNLDIREKELRKKIEEQNYILCKKLFQELLDNKMQRAYNQSLANKKYTAPQELI